MIKLHHSFCIAQPPSSNFHRVNILVVRVVVRWRHVQQILVDIELSRSRRDHRRTSMELLTRLVDRLDKNIDFCLQTKDFEILFVMRKNVLKKNVEAQLGKISP
jgi:hypothetical protein